MILNELYFRLKSIILIFVLSIISFNKLYAQNYSTIIWHNSGTQIAFKVEDIDSISISETKDVHENLFYQAFQTINYDTLFVNDGFISSTGNIGHHNEQFTYTDLISIKNVIEIEVYACMKNKAGGGVCFYDSNGEFISSIYNVDNTNLYDTKNYFYVINKEDIPQTAKYIRVQSGFKEKGKVILNFKYSFVKEEENLANTAVTSKTELINKGEAIILPHTNVRRNTTLNAVCRFNEFEEISIGRGYNDYRGYGVIIDNDSVYSYEYNYKVEKLIATYKHGLTIRDNLTVLIDYTETDAILILNSNGQVYTTSIKWWAGGKPFILNKGNNPISATLSFTPKDVFQPVWFFADSYFNWTTHERWPYYFLKQGYTKWFADHKPGEASKEAIICFEYDIQLGHPQYIIWCLGMNDASDNDAPDEIWLNSVKLFIDVCEKKGITPILTTIPNVPNRNHRMKNSWIKNSGYLYIDFAEAVGAHENENWIEGMLSNDKVHPSASGAEALSNQILKDFPQIKELCK